MNTIVKKVWRQIVLAFLIFIPSMYILIEKGSACAPNSDPLWCTVSTVNMFVFHWPTFLTTSVLGNASVIFSFIWILLIASLVVFVYDKISGEVHK